MNAVVESLVQPATSSVSSATVLKYEIGANSTSLLKRKPQQIVVNPGASYSGMRIVFVNRYFYPDISATSQMLFDLTRRLVKHGIEVSVVCSQQLYDNSQAHLPAEEVVEGITVHRVRTTRFGRDRLAGRAMDYLSFYATAASKLLAITQPGDVLVAKTDPPLISVITAAVAKWRGAKSVNWLQDVFPEVAAHLGNRLPGWLESILLRLRDQSLKQASANVAIGARMQEHLLRRNIDAASIHVVENWADGDYLEPKRASASALRISLGLHDKFVVGYSGNLGRAHEYETILNAAMALRQERDVVFLMVGGGAKMQQLKQAVAERCLDNFRFLAYQPREVLADSMAAADVHLTSLLPGLEGLIVPSKFYGILAAGRPSIIIGDTDGELARVVKREGCGEVVQVGDWDALVSSLWHMKLEPAYRQQLGMRARTVFMERYTADRAAQKWLHILTQTATVSQIVAAQPVSATTD